MTDEVSPSYSGPEGLEIVVRQNAGLPTNNLVISKIIEISREMPENVNQIMPAQADYLAGRFLIGIDLCGELAGLALANLLKAEMLKKKEYSIAYHVRSAEQGCRTGKDKEQYPYRDEQYLQAELKYIEASMFKKMVEEKHNILEKAHYHMRKIADKDPDAGYKQSVNLTKITHGETDWT
jgi:hypothetical protein